MTLPGGVPPSLRNMPPAAFPHSQVQSRHAPSQSQQQQQGPFAMTPQHTQQQEQFALARQMHHFAHCQDVTSPIPAAAAAAAVSSGTPASSSALVGRVHPLSPGKKSVVNDVTMTSRAAPFLLPDASDIFVAREEPLILRQDRSATIIQAAARGYSDRSRYCWDVQSVIIVQSLVRRRADQKLALQTRRHHHHHYDNATIQIQNWYRSHSVLVVRKRYQRDLWRILMVQSFVRCRIARRIADDERQKRRRQVKSATTNMKQVPTGSCMSPGYQNAWNVIIVQSLVRRWLVRRHVIENRRHGVNVLNENATNVPSSVRHVRAASQQQQQQQQVESADAATLRTENLQQEVSREVVYHQDERKRDATVATPDNDTAPTMSADNLHEESSREGKRVSRRDKTDDDAMKNNRKETDQDERIDHAVQAALTSTGPTGTRELSETSHEAKDDDVVKGTPNNTGPTSTDDRYTTQEPFHDAKTVSGQDEIRDDAMRSAINDTGEKKRPSNEGGVYFIVHDTVEVPISQPGSQGGSTDCWTDQEERLFRRAYDRYGGYDATKIAKIVKTRTVVQIRTHIEKYLQDIKKMKEAAAKNRMVIGAVETAEFIRDKWIKRMMADVDNDESTPSGIKGGPVAKGTQDFPTTPEIATQAEKESSQCASEGYAVTSTPNTTVRKERYSLNGAKENDDALDGEAKSRRKPHHHYHRHLNEDTLNLLKSHLQSDPGEYLDEDAVAARMLKTERVKRTQLCDDSEGEDDDVARRQAYQNAEDNAFAFDFYKNTVDATRKANPGSVLDKKTLDWLRRAMGLHRDLFVETIADSQGEQFVRSHAVAGSQNPTQGVARSSRIRKRKERETRETMALDALMWGITNAEEELSARRARKASTKRKKQKSHRGAVKPPEKNPRKRHCSNSRILPVMTSHQKYEYRQKSIGKPTWTQEDTCNTSMKSPVSSSFAKPRLSIGPAAPPLSMAPILSCRGRKKELHGLATLAQQFRHIVTNSGSQDIDLRAVVNMLGIPKRRIYDVVNILDGAGFMEKTRERNHFRWVPTVDDVTQMDKQLRQLEEEERQLDEWIQHRTASVQVMKRKYIDGITRAQKRTRTMATEKKKRENTAAVKKARVIPPPVKPLPNPVTPATTDSATDPATKASAATPSTLAATRPPVLSKHTRKLHCLATLAQRFQQVITLSNTFDIDLQDVVSQLGIPKRRIYDVVNVLAGAGVMRRISSNKYHWISRVDVSPSHLKTLYEEERQLKEEERQLDEWIRIVSNLNREILASRSISPIAASMTSESS